MQFMYNTLASSCSDKSIQVADWLFPLARAIVFAAISYMIVGPN